VLLAWRMDKATVVQLTMVVATKARRARSFDCEVFQEAGLAIILHAVKKMIRRIFERLRLQFGVEEFRKEYRGAQRDLFEAFG
jgi:hypothetical protein